MIRQYVSHRTPSTTQPCIFNRQISNARSRTHISDLVNTNGTAAYHQIRNRPQIDQQRHQRNSITPSTINTINQSINSMVQQKASVELGKLWDAPSLNLDFPTGNITAVEILTFLPNWLKSQDVVERLMRNGGKTGNFSLISNTCRVMVKGVVSNSTLVRTMQGATAPRGQAGKVRYQGWTPGKHEVPQGWDTTTISVTGFRPPYVTHPGKAMPNNNFNAAVDPIPFYKLADGVKYFPAGPDGLDLTRCIGYHLQHKKEKWLFPDDFVKLVEKIGPSTLTPLHLDGWAFQRWGAKATSVTVTPRGQNGVPLDAPVVVPPTYNNFLGRGQGYDGDQATGTTAVSQNTIISQSRNSSHYSSPISSTISSPISSTISSPISSPPASTVDKQESQPTSSRTPSPISSTVEEQESQSTSSSAVEEQEAEASRLNGLLKSLCGRIEASVTNLKPLDNHLTPLPGSLVSSQGVLEVIYTDPKSVYDAVEPLGPNDTLCQLMKDRMASTELALISLRDTVDDLLDSSKSSLQKINAMRTDLTTVRKFLNVLAYHPFPVPSHEASSSGEEETETETSDDDWNEELEISIEADDNQSKGSDEEDDNESDLSDPPSDLSDLAPRSATSPEVVSNHDSEMGDAELCEESSDVGGAAPAPVQMDEHLSIVRDAGGAAPAPEETVEHLFIVRDAGCVDEDVHMEDAYEDLGTHDADITMDELIQDTPDHETVTPQDSDVVTGANDNLVDDHFATGVSGFQVSGDPSSLNPAQVQAVEDLKAWMQACRNELDALMTAVDSETEYQQRAMSADPLTAAAGAEFFPGFIDLSSYANEAEHVTESTSAEAMEIDAVHPHTEPSEP
ncbi:hypothetical protein M011DRAFT_289530 [Sporormia fimetaria CBS 119925]|uniref:Uncharacterized protein n=1 Tax=Sporormia fimetaria CBS 119925 TaxID=1340428 RepID=A0A6A6UZ89_9PLEO|nr:hypothetical protein M011DRAFT_289530 [Sporormia fimetaria CBS 119925]